jgi:hypothetical protein
MLLTPLNISILVAFSEDILEAYNRRHRLIVRFWRDIFCVAASVRVCFA